MEIRFICIKKDFLFIPNKEYLFTKYNDLYKSNDYYGWYTDNYIKIHFVINKKYYRELNLKNLLDD